MSDFIAGPPSGAHDGATDDRTGGAPPTVLLAALGAALLIAVTLIALLASSGGGDESAVVPTPLGDAGAPAQKRVLLTVSVEGSGSGRVRLAPGETSCRRSCERRFASGTRVTATADPASGSTFEDWGDACDGAADCSFVLDEERALSARFEESAPGPVDVPDGRPAAPADCQDGRDNDGDGLVDSAQDPGCVENDTEADATAAPSATTPPPPPPPRAASNDCADGRDNDGDGLRDRAQDPDCVTGTSERGTSASPTRAPSDCRDGRDNDGDGLTDSAQDPDCTGGRSEAG